MNVAIEEKTEVAPTDVHGNKLYAHIVNPTKNLHIYKPGMSSMDMVRIARENDIILFALCGVRVLPKNNPDNLDACDKCIKTAHDMIRESGK